jgi:hypothetical protein
VGVQDWKILRMDTRLSTGPNLLPPPRRAHPTVAASQPTRPRPPPRRLPPPPHGASLGVGRILASTLLRASSLRTRGL